jgi:hypothetical protein
MPIHVITTAHNQKRRDVIEARLAFFDAPFRASSSGKSSNSGWRLAAPRWRLLGSAVVVRSVMCQHSSESLKLDRLRRAADTRMPDYLRYEA